jgi:hypothetical protein
LILNLSNKSNNGNLSRVIQIIFSVWYAQAGELRALIAIIIPALVALFTALPSQATAQNNFPNSIFTFTSLAQPHELSLRATLENGQTNPVSGFTNDLTNVISTPTNSELIMFTTDNTISIVEAKVRTITDIQTDLANTKPNAFSLAGLSPGVYTLDVIVQKQNSKAAYEGILVIGQPLTESTKQIVQNEIVNKNDDIRIVFEKKSNQKQSGNDPCNYYGRNICNSQGYCDSDRFDCLSDDCVNGQPGTTGQCEGDDRPFRSIAQTNNELPLCDGSFQDCITERGDVCEAGSSEHECEIEEPEELSCQEDDDFCEPGCEDENMQCIDDTEEDSPDEDIGIEDEADASQSRSEDDNDSSDNGDEGGGDDGPVDFGSGDEGGGDEGGN